MVEGYELILLLQIVYVKMFGVSRPKILYG